MTIHSIIRGTVDHGGISGSEDHVGARGNRDPGGSRGTEDQGGHEQSEDQGRTAWGLRRPRQRDVRDRIAKAESGTWRAVMELESRK